METWLCSEIMWENFGKKIEKIVLLYGPLTLETQRK